MKVIVRSFATESPTSVELDVLVIQIIFCLEAPLLNFSPQVCTKKSDVKFYALYFACYTRIVCEVDTGLRMSKFMA